MNLILHQCIEYNDKRNICVATEKGKTYTLNNVSRYKIRKVKVDKCLVQKEREKRCDYLLDIDDDKLGRVIFIELKGSGLTHALKQLYSTSIYLKDEFKDYQLDARIVGSRNVPMIRITPDYIKLFKMVRDTNGEIRIATNKVYSENI